MTQTTTITLTKNLQGQQSYYQERACNFLSYHVTGLQQDIETAFSLGDKNKTLLSRIASIALRVIGAVTMFLATASAIGAVVTLSPISLITAIFFLVLGHDLMEISANLSQILNLKNGREPLIKKGTKTHVQNQTSKEKVFNVLKKAAKSVKDVAKGACASTFETLWNDNPYDALSRLAVKNTWVSGRIYKGLSTNVKKVVGKGFVVLVNTKIDDIKKLAQG